MRLRRRKAWREQGGGGGGGGGGPGMQLSHVQLEDVPGAGAALCAPVMWRRCTLWMCTEIDQITALSPLLSCPAPPPAAHQAGWSREFAA